MNKIKKNISVLLLIGIVLTFFYPFFLFGKLPIPSESMVGLYHPYRDLYASTNPNGIAYKNFLITDPFRQQIPWRYIAVENLKKFELPLWNPYEMGGHPLLANMQAGVLYPFNILFLFGEFKIIWSILIILQVLLSSLFMYFYLKELGLQNNSSCYGSISFAFSGFCIAWMAWNTIIHVALWLPLLLLVSERLLKNRSSIWIGIGIGALSSAFFAGHIQTFIYLFIVFLLYSIGKGFVLLRNNDKELKKQVGTYFFSLLLIISVSFGITYPQWISTFQLMNTSAREIDRANWENIEGWFFPSAHLIQFFAPDFFGNPSTLNYWGTWNYGELVGYIGVIPLLFAVYAIISRRDKKTYFFISLVVASFLLLVESPFSKIPYILQFPFFSSAQPTRLLFIIDFSLCVLASFGFEIINKNKKQMWLALMIFGVFFVFLWGMIVINDKSFFRNITNNEIASRNLIFPSIIFLQFLVLYGIYQKFSNYFVKSSVIFLVFLITVLELFRFGWKFIPFSDSKYFFPTTKVISYLKNNSGNERILITNEKILPPNISSYYKIYTVSGYDPLYLLEYGEIVAALQRDNHSILPPFGFNRIINPKNYNSQVIDLLGVKYVLSLEKIKSEKLDLVFSEGNTYVYKNNNVFPRAFFVEKIHLMTEKEDTIDFLFNPSHNLKKEAVISSKNNSLYQKLQVGSVHIVKYQNNLVEITTNNKGNGFLVLTDVYYPSWRVFIDGIKAEIVKTNFLLRGVFIPSGTHTITFINTI